MHKEGFTHIYYGDGKGKTSAAIGLSIRALGAGKTILFAQFLKDGTSGECGVLAKLGADVHVGRHPTSGFFHQLNEWEKEELKNAQRSLFKTASSAVLSGAYDIFVLDEVLDAVTLDILGWEMLIKLIQANKTCELVLTGRYPGPLLIHADYATRMSGVAHPYGKGISARKGIEY